MATLYVDRMDATLRVRNGCVVLAVAGGAGRSVPLAHLERVVLRARTVLDSATLAALAGANVSVVGLSGRHGERVFQVAVRGPRDGMRRLAQYRACQLPEQCLRGARRLVAAKLHGQARVLARGAAQRPDQRLAVRRALRGVRGALKAVPAVASLEALRGVEGAGAAAYFSGFVRLFAPGLGFTGRNRRPPRDPVNAVLSLAYTLVHARAVAACHGAGLDPLLGFLHAPAWGRESLACDLVEPLRPHVDAWVWGLFQARTLRAESFVHDKGACLLGKAGRTHFYPLFELAARPWQRYLRRATRQVVLALEPLAPGWVAHDLPDDEPA